MRQVFGLISSGNAGCLPKTDCGSSGFYPSPFHRKAEVKITAAGLSGIHTRVPF